MKYLNNKILEAIQKGINLAVDDFDDLDTAIEVQKKSRIKDDVHMKDLLPWVDLGLPSGTLWYKYNVGVDPGQLENNIDWYGNYYTFDKANNLEGYTLPTQEQIQELLDETKSEWVENYNGIEGLNGRSFTSKNGKSIFIPAAGYYSYSGSSSYRTGDFCFCQSSSLHLPDSRSSYCLFFGSSTVSLSIDDRYNGFSARPVLNRKS